MKPRKKTSPVWKPSTQELIAILDSCDSLNEAVIKLGLRVGGSSFRTLTQRLKEEGICYERFKLNKRCGGKFRRAPLESVMVANSTYNRGSLKRRMIADGLIEQTCSQCGHSGDWQGKPLVLVLDHINGVYNDHRRENLRLLCPNCNSQTATFAARNRPYKKHTPGSSS